MSLTNAQPRFAVETNDGTIFDYQTNRHMPATGLYETTDGTWDLAMLKSLIEAGQPIGPAFKPKLPPVLTDAIDKVEKADADFLAAAHQDAT
jgi:hypothetical protein